MSILNVSGLSKAFGENQLLDRVSFNVEPGDKIGLVGRNGAGKTTLFNMLLSNEPTDSGVITFGKDVKTGHLSQFIVSDTERSLWDELCDTFSELIRTEDKLEEMTRELSRDDIDPNEREQLILRHTRIHERFVSDGGLYYKSRISATLRGLGFSEDDFSRKLSTLSGGQLSKLALSKLLLSDCNLLLLDEPTNHLDIDAMEWLEDYLINLSCAFIVISHDRYLLDRVTNKTMEIDRGRLSVFGGGYSSYMSHKESENESVRRRYDNTMREIKRIEGIVKQQRQWNRERNIKTAESKLKQIERLKADLIVPESAERHLSFSFAAAKRGSSDALRVEDIHVEYNGKPVLRGVSFDIADAERVFLLGPNGSGKTTLLHSVMGYTKYRGEIKKGPSCDIAYFDQMGRTLSSEKDVLGQVWDEFPELTQTEVRSALAQFLFTGDDIYKNIGELSGGERARVALLCVMLKGANFLLLDEPTNHLDIYSKEALEDALIEYGGTMLVISHDRYFINKLSDRILYLEDGRISDFAGSYDEFAQNRRTAAKAVSASKPNTDAKTEFLKKKERQSKLRSLRVKVKNIENEISDLETKLRDTEAQLSLDEVARDYKRTLELSQFQEELSHELEGAYDKWSSLSEELSALESLESQKV